MVGLTGHYPPICISTPRRAPSISRQLLGVQFMLDAARLIAVGSAAYMCVALDRQSKRIATLAFTGRVWLPNPDA